MKSHGFYRDLELGEGEQALAGGEAMSIPWGEWHRPQRPLARLVKGAESALLEAWSVCHTSCQFLPGGHLILTMTSCQRLLSGFSDVETEAGRAPFKAA